MSNASAKSNNNDDEKKEQNNQTQKPTVSAPPTVSAQPTVPEDKSLIKQMDTRLYGHYKKLGRAVDWYSNDGIGKFQTWYE